MEQMEAEETAKDMALAWYRQGRLDFSLGRRYEPPDNAILRLSYCIGWEDDLNCLYPNDQEVLLSIFGV